MKRSIAALLAILLCVAHVPAIQAADLAEADRIFGTAELEEFAAYDDEEDVELNDFTYQSAKAVIKGKGWEGISCRVEDWRFWLLAAMEKAELTQQGIDSGYLAVYLADDCEVSVVRVDYGNLDLKGYLSAVKQNKVNNARITEVNGVEAVVYDEVQKDKTLCRIAAFLEADGSFVEFIFRAKDNVMSLPIDVTIASIRTEK